MHYNTHWLPYARMEYVAERETVSRLYRIVSPTMVDYCTGYKIRLGSLFQRLFTIIISYYDKLVNSKITINYLKRVYTYIIT